MTWTAQAETALDGVAETGVHAAAIVAAAWRAGVDPGATAGLAAAALAMYAEPRDLLTGPLHPLPSDRELIAQAADVATDAGDHGHAVRRLSEQVIAAMQAAARAAGAAARRAAHAETRSEAAAARAELRQAEREIADCEAAVELLIGAGTRLDKALAGVARVPDDLLDVYELAFEHRRHGGTFPNRGDFLTATVVQ